MSRRRTQSVVFSKILPTAQGAFCILLRVPVVLISIFGPSIKWQNGVVGMGVWRIEKSIWGGLSSRCKDESYSNSRARKLWCSRKSEAWLVGVSNSLGYQFYIPHTAVQCCILLQSFIESELQLCQNIALAPTTLLRHVGNDLRFTEGSWGYSWRCPLQIQAFLTLHPRGSSWPNSRLGWSIPFWHQFHLGALEVSVARSIEFFGDYLH